MTTTKAISDCPICGAHTLVAHCDEEAACKWTQCRSRGCLAVLDLPNLRGYRPTEGGFERVTIPAA